jgi:hypothetical protein
VPDIPPLTPTAVEFLYSYDGTAITLVDRFDIAAIAPADDGPVGAGQEPAGFWCELRDAAGTTLWRSIDRHPKLVLTEVMLDDDTFGYTNVAPVGPPVGFTVTVPGDLTDAKTVALVGTDPLDGSGAPPADLLVHPFAAPVA